MIASRIATCVLFAISVLGNQAGHWTTESVEKKTLAYRIGCEIYTPYVCEQTSLEFYGIKKWKEAVETCAHDGGFLVSDETKYNLNYTVWSGRYTHYTKWRVIMGCFEIEAQNIIYYADDGFVTCYEKCKEFDYFALKVINDLSSCVCLENVDQNDKRSYLQCRCNKCLHVYQHQLKPVNKGEVNENVCLAVTCVEDEHILTEESCDMHYSATCDNNSYCDANGLSHQSATTCCESKSSFIQLVDDDICMDSSNDYFWTSGSRNVLESVISKDDIHLDDLSLAMCELAIWDDSSESFVFEEAHCGDEYPFYCELNSYAESTTHQRADSSFHYSTDTVSTHSSQSSASRTETDATRGFPSLSPTYTDYDVDTGVSSSTDKFEPSSSQTSAENMTEMKRTIEDSPTQAAAFIAGIIVPVIAIILVVIVVVVIRRRSETRDQKKDLDNSTNVYSITNSNELQPFSVANQSYDDVNDGVLKPSTGTTLSPNYELAKDAINVKKGTNPAPSYALVNKSNTAESYEFAKPIAYESDYVYNSDYDHLHKILKTKQESDYALTCPERNSKRYDTSASSNDLDGQQAVSDYDHLPTDVGNDPTYDFAALKSRKQVDNNYDSF